MKLAASIIFSLVAIATYASPAAYPEDQVDVQHSAINEPVIVHLEKRAGDQPGFMERISNIQKSVNYNHHQPGHQGHQGHRGYQGHQEYQRRQKQERQERQERWQMLHHEHQRREQERREQYGHQRRQQERQQQENQGLESYKKDVQKWKDNQLLGSDGYEHRNGTFFYPKHLVNGQRPNLVKPSDKVLAQLGTTNKHRNERKNSWEEMGDDKAPHKRPEQGYDFYQDRGDLYRKRMQTDEGKKQHAERIRILEEGRGVNEFDQMLEDHIATAVGLHDPLEPVPKVVKNKSGLNAIFNKPPKPSKSILTKEYAGTKNERKVGFNEVVQLATFERPEHKGPVQTDVSTEDSTDATGEQSDNQGPPQTDVPTEGSTDATGEQSDDQGPPQSEESTKSKQSGSKRFRDIIMGPDYITGQRLKNPTVFETQEIPINDSEDTTSKQSENEDPPQSEESTEGTTDATDNQDPLLSEKSTKRNPFGLKWSGINPLQSKKSTKRRPLSFKWFGNKSKGSTDTTSKQSEDEDPTQGKVSTENSTDATDNQDPLQSKKSTKRNPFSLKWSGNKSKGSTDTTSKQSEDEDPTQGKVSTEDSTDATDNQDPLQSKKSTKRRPLSFKWFGNKSKGSTDTTSEQSDNQDPSQGKVSTNGFTDATGKQSGNQYPSQKSGSLPLSRFERVMYQS
ncbi:hypothetical protein BASA61_007399 [Batrachochytrium salamandrivorans]|nr:hypothetical protein BASA61_007399 [Batrachochytrium salamandrivorans]